MDPTTLIVSLVIALAAIFILANSIKVIRQQRVGVVERLGKFNRTLESGPAPAGARAGQGALSTSTCARPSSRSRRRA